MTQTYSQCPECSNARTKSGDKCLSTNVETGVYNCHHCGLSGKHNGQKQAATPRAGAASGKHAAGSQKVGGTEILKLPESPLPDNVVKFFMDRSISKEILERNQIKFNGREVLFPYFRNGELLNIKYRTLDKRFRQESGADKIFYGLDDIVKQEVAVVVEGEFDKLALEVAGFINVLSVPDGAPSPTAKSYESKFSYIQNCEEALKDIKKFILAVDSDAPGKKLEEELIRRLGPERCYIATWPESCKDANDALAKHGASKLKKTIDDAKPVPISGLFSIDDFSDDLLRLYNQGGQKGLTTGWHSLDVYYTIRQGEMSLATGIPSHGKSEFIDALMVNLAIRYDWRFAIFSPENFPIESHAAKLAKKFIGKPFHKGFSARMSKDEFDASREWLSEYFTFISPPDEELTIDHIIAKAKVAVARFGIKGLVIDPYNEIDNARPQGLSETEYISKCLTKIRRFARAYKVHVWLIAHPTKLYKDKITGKYPVPNPYDIAGSAHFRNKADNCICVWRDLLDESKSVQIHIQKVRFREVGKPGKVELKYNIASGRYSEIFERNQ